MAFLKNLGALEDDSALASTRTSLSPPPTLFMVKRLV